MYTATFIFEKKDFDDEFHALDRAIAAAARAIPGYLGEESWENPSTGLACNVYYWESLQDLQALMNNPHHLLAKAGHTKWLRGYRVVIAEVQRQYGALGLGLVPAQAMPPPSG
jgi:heme-degrading monooxygenase HmoA